MDDFFSTFDPPEGTTDGGSLGLDFNEYLNLHDTSKHLNLISDEDLLDNGNLIPLSDNALLTRDVSSDGKSSKRTFEDFSLADSSYPYDSFPTWFTETFPDLLPSIPLSAERKVDFGNSNPFEVNGVILHPRLQCRSTSLAPVAQDGAVNGLVKFRLRVTADGNSSSKSQLQWKKAGSNEWKTTGEGEANAYNPFLHPCPNLPYDFGRGLKLNTTDAKLFKFYTIAFCGGRTLLPNSNGFFNDITPMASGSASVKHALLALSASYVLDYLPSKKLQLRANMHHKRAVLLLGQELNKAETFQPGKGEAAVAALVLLCHDDLVNWEMDRIRSRSPKWLNGYQAARMILDKSDPGYKHHHPMYVQASNARRYLGSKAALETILCSVASPLEPTKKCPYPWLLAGTEREIRKIDGLNGFSSKLLHAFAQITHLCGRLAADPVSIVVYKATKLLDRRLHNFRQWSDLSEGYPDGPSDLLNTCAVEAGPNGKVSCPVKVTELIAESYVATAQIYLQCRLFRQPRTHPLVQQILSVLLRCISYQPTDGPLFTAQAPLFPVFIAGAVAFRPADRDVVSAWFDGVCSGSRGNVPPSYRAMKIVWAWQDDILAMEEVGDYADGLTFLSEEDVGKRRAWWEEMVEVIEREEGRMNLG